MPNTTVNIPAVIEKIRAHGAALNPSLVNFYDLREAAMIAAEALESLLAALKKCDLDCAYCKHNTDNDGRCTDLHIDCENCTIPCPCRSCMDMDKWEWCGPKEGKA